MTGFLHSSQNIFSPLKILLYCAYISLYIFMRSFESKSNISREPQRSTRPETRDGSWVRKLALIAAAVTSGAGMEGCATSNMRQEVTTASNETSRTSPETWHELRSLEQFAHSWGNETGRALLTTVRNRLNGYALDRVNRPEVSELDLALGDTVAAINLGREFHESLQVTHVSENGDEYDRVHPTRTFNPRHVRTAQEYSHSLLETSPAARLLFVRLAERLIERGEVTTEGTDLLNRHLAQISLTSPERAEDSYVQLSDTFNENELLLLQAILMRSVGNRGNADYFREQLREVSSGRISRHFLRVSVIHRIAERNRLIRDADLGLHDERAEGNAQPIELFGGIALSDRGRVERNLTTRLIEAFMTSNQ